MIRRALVRLAVLATLATLLSPIPPADAQPGGCLRFAHHSGYTATFVIVGRPCMSVVVYRCRGHERMRQRLAHVRPITVATVECPYPVKFARIRPARGVR